MKFDYDIEKDVFDKEIHCPICNSKFKAKCVKVNAPRIESKDSDFFIRYKYTNPYFYDVWLCNNCGYAALKSDFMNIKSYHKNLLLSNITYKWKPRQYPSIFTAELAIERYKLALLSSIALEKPNSTQGMILLKISWMYRLLDDPNEIDTLKHSLSCFMKAFELENFPIYGMQRDSFTYLIGELYRRCGNLDVALQWYSKVITTIGASYKIKEMARNGKDLIKTSISN